MSHNNDAFDIESTEKQVEMWEVSSALSLTDPFLNGIMGEGGVYRDLFV